MIFLLGASTGFAQQLNSVGPQPVTTTNLHELIEQALENNPEIKAMQRRYDMMRARIPQAKALDQPMLSVGYMGNIAPFYVQRDDPSSGRSISISQDFPYPGKRSLKGKVASSDAEAEWWSFEQTRRNVVAEVKDAYFDLYFVTKALGVVTKTKSLIDQFIKIAEARYAVGKGIQQDVLKAQVEFSKLLEQQTVFEQRKQIARLNVEDQQVLEAASISGMNFSALAVASALGQDVLEVEARCEELARRNCFLRVRGVAEFPDGTVSGRYGFIHWLYVNTLYERIPAARRARLHKDMAEQGEAIYGNRAAEIGTELAVHFERGRDYQRAAKYLQKAADNAIRRFAYREAVGLARRGLELLTKLPESTERAEQELCLQLTLGMPLVATEGYASPAVGKAYLKARDILQRLGETPDISEVLWGLWAFHLLRAELETAREIAEEFLRLAQRLQYPGLAMRGHLITGVTFAHKGDFTLALDHSEKAFSLYDPKQHRDDAFYYSQNPGVAMLCHAAWVLWFLGLRDQSLVRMHESLKLANELSEPHGLAHALFFASVLYQLGGAAPMAQERAEAAVAFSREHGLLMYEAHAMITRGWALVQQGIEIEGIEQIRQGLVAHEATSTEVMRPHFWALLAESLGKAGQYDEGLRVLEDALSLIQRNGERYYEAELYRLKGELLLMQSKYGDLAAATRGRALLDAERSMVTQAEDCFKQSINIAQRQKAKSWELRAVLSIARLYMNRGKQAEARSFLTQIYDKFTEGFDTVELREARALLNGVV
jgi:predicted ATPase